MEGGKEQSTSREVQEVDMAEGGSGRRMGGVAGDQGGDPLMTSLMCQASVSGSWRDWIL